MARSFMFAVLLLSLAACSAWSSVPTVINYQGKLMQPSGAPVPDNIYQMTFAIYDVPTGGTALWSETNPSVQVKGGLYSVLLGSVNPIQPSVFSGPNRWFGVKVGADPEMTPRQKVATVAYAASASAADIADTVPDGAITTTKVADLCITTAKLGNGSVTAEKLEAQESWRNAVLQNGWVNYDPRFGAAKYYKDGLGIVHLTGVVKGGTAGSTILTLPAGYRPGLDLILVGFTSVLSGLGGDSYACRIDVEADGRVLAHDNAGNTCIGLSPVSFRAEQ